MPDEPFVIKPPDHIDVCARCGWTAWKPNYPCYRCGGLEAIRYVPESKPAFDEEGQR